MTNLTLVSGTVMFIVSIVRLFNDAVSCREVVEGPVIQEGSHE